MKPPAVSSSQDTSQPLVAALPLLRVKRVSQGTTDVLTISGEMDISNVTDVQQLVDRSLAERPETLLLDLSGIEFCDSAGIHLVLQAHRHATATDIRFRVVPPNGAARRVFDLCCVGDVVTFVAPDLTSAGP